MNKTISIFIILFFSLALFASSQSFVTPTTPMHYIAFGGCLVCGLLWSAYGIKIPANGLAVSEWAMLLFLLLGGVAGYLQGSLYPEFLISGISLLVLYGVVRRMRFREAWLSVAFVLLGIVQSGYGIGQYLHWLPNPNEAFVICGSFDNPAGYAASLVMLFPFALQLVGRKSVWMKALGGLSAIAIVAAVVMSQSRAGMVALSVVALFWLYGIYPVDILKRLSRGVRMAAGGVVVLALVAGLYFLKKDSANGRLLIWQSSARMIVDKPLLGHGVGGFQREYMLYQAGFFKDHPDSSFAMLSDIVKHPFNEYLLLFVEHGLLGILFLGLIVYLLIKNWRLHPSEENRYAGLCLIGLALFSCFSYPLNYPFVRLMAVFAAAVVMRDEVRMWLFSRIVVYVVKPVMIISCLGLLFVSGMMCCDEYRWCDIAHRSLVGETLHVLPDYARLRKTMNRNALFLYNYGAELNYIGEWEQSNKLLQECARYYNDIDLQLLLADNYTQIRQYRKAEQCLLLAHQMIPNRFVPLYRLALLCKETGRSNRAQALARIIVRKPVKVISPEVMSIKAEMRGMLR